MRGYDVKEWGGGGVGDRSSDLVSPTVNQPFYEALVTNNNLGI